MSHPLATYLHDHLAGAQFAIDLLHAISERHAGELQGELASALLAEIEEDRATLRDLADQLGDEGNRMKEAAAWLAEKAARVKLLLGRNSELGGLESWEMLSLGVLGKRALWRALLEIVPALPALSSAELTRLIDRAESQYDRMEKMRLTMARTALLATAS